jgi:AraC-like DNA-binding protein
VIEFIHQHYIEPIGLDDIARASACSVSSLSHVFAQVMHFTPIEYRNRLRVVRAMELLCGTNEKLSRIATQVGFESLSQFHDLFKRVTGRTPASVRG